MSRTYYGTDTSTTTYARGTSTTSRYPWGTFVTARVLCSDGRVRTVKRISATADTFFSVPCSVVVAGRTVAGYLTCETMEGFTCETPDDPAVVKFCAYLYRKNHDALPEGTYRATA